MEIAPFGYQIKNEIEIEPFDSFNVHVQIYKKKKDKKNTEKTTHFTEIITMIEIDLGM